MFPCLVLQIEIDETDRRIWYTIVSVGWGKNVLTDDMTLHRDTKNEQQLWWLVKEKGKLCIH